jgi:hypothetical protein
MRILCIFVVGLASVVLGGCAESQPLPGSSGSPATSAQPTVPPTPASECTLPLPIDTPQNTTCPAKCVAVTASQLAQSDSGSCSRQVLLGCISCENGCGGAPEGPCYRNTNDQRIVRAPQYAITGRPGWVACTEQEDALIGGAAPCP